MHHMTEGWGTAHVDRSLPLSATLKQDACLARVVLFRVLYVKEHVTCACVRASAVATTVASVGLLAFVQPCVSVECCRTCACTVLP